MVERLEGEIFLRDKSSGQLRNVEAEVKRLNKTIVAGGRGSKAAAASLKQLRQAAAALGTELRGDAAPAVNRTARELEALRRSSDAASMSLRRTDRALGLTAAKAGAFTRAGTRAVAAIGFISPTAATASAQLVGLTDASAAATFAIGAAAVGGIALGTALFASSKAAISFEASFRGIRKTVNATEEAYARLESQNRKLAIALGENVNTINAVGQAAGQLGIAIRDLARFEQIVIELASASDITANAAAFAFGGLIKVLRLTVEDIDRLSDEIVELGNTVSATESEIVGLMSRIAGAGAVLKIPAADLAAIAAAFSEVRVEQEAAGTAIQKVFLALQRAAVTGGDTLRKFSRMLGITASEFQKMAREDPTEVFVRFVEALSKSGEKAQLWLEELGLTNERLRRTFLKISAAQDLLRQRLEEGTAAYREGTARTEEHEKALGTATGQLRIARAAITDLAISIGDALLPAITEGAQLLADFAAALRTMGDATIYTKRTVEDLVGPLNKLNISLKDFLLTWVKTVAPMFAVLDSMKKGISLLRESSDEAADAAAGMGDALSESIAGATGAASAFQDTLGGLETDIASVGETAEDARKKLFAMFKEPTVEETKAKLVVLGLKRELLELLTATRPLSEAEKDRADILKKHWIPAAQQAVDLARLQGDIRAEQYRLAQGGLQTLDAQAAAYNNQAQAIANMNTQLRDIPMEISAAAAIDATWRALVRLVDQADALTQQKFEFVVEVLGVEKARAALRDLLAWGGRLTAEDFVMNVRVAGAEYAQAQIIALLRAGNALARQAVAFGVLTEKNPATLAAIAKQLEQMSSQLFAPIPPYVPPPYRGDTTAARGGAAAKVLTLADALKDSIISLAEAAELGLSVSQAATAELSHEQEKLADRMWRTRVESEKLAEFYSTEAAVIQRAQVELAEAEVETAKKTIELRVELAKLYIALRAPATAVKDAAQLLLEGQVAFAENLRRTNAEVAALQVIVGEAGLGRHIATFRHALVGLGEGFRQAEESILAFLARLSQAALNAVRQRFDDLFERPTREQAQLSLALAEARRRRLLQAQAGASEDILRATDDEIERIQAAIDLRRAEEDIMRARADLADRTLLTEHEQFRLAQVLIGIIAQQSAITAQVNAALAMEQMALIGVVDALNLFRGALVAARDTVSQRALPAGRPALNVAVHVNVDPQLSDLRSEVLRTVNRELDAQLRRAEFGGTNVATGTFVPG